MAKMSMKEAYNAVAADEPKREKPSGKAAGKPAFLSTKKGATHSSITTCPECGAHFQTEYTS